MFFCFMLYRIARAKGRHCQQIESQLDEFTMLKEKKKQNKSFTLIVYIFLLAQFSKQNDFESEFLHCCRETKI